MWKIFFEAKGTCPMNRLIYHITVYFNSPFWNQYIFQKFKMSIFFPFRVRTAPVKETQWIHRIHNTPVARRVGLVLKSCLSPMQLASSCMWVWFADSMPTLVGFLHTPVSSYTLKLRPLPIISVPLFWYYVVRMCLWLPIRALVHLTVVPWALNRDMSCVIRPHY